MHSEIRFEESHNLDRVYLVFDDDQQIGHISHGLDEWLLITYVTSVLSQADLSTIVEFMEGLG